MASLQKQRMINLLCWLYRLLLVAYPPLFRKEYGTEMAMVFRDCCQYRVRTGGLASLFLLLLHTLADLLKSACMERLAQLTQWISLWRFGRCVDEFYGVENPFRAHVIQLIEREPAYYPLLVSFRPSRKFRDMVESIILDGDLSEPQTVLSLFEGFLDEEDANQRMPWLSRMCDIARGFYRGAQPDRATNTTDRYLTQIYENPRLFELLAADEIENRLLDAVERLALDTTIDEVEPMLTMMYELSGEES